MKKLLILSLCSLLITGCNPSNDKVAEFAEKEISLTMKDPNNLIFSDVSTKKLGIGANGNNAYCVLGKVNGKNSFGAYAGAIPFAVTLVVESQLLPIIEPTYKLGSKVIANDEGTAIRYMALSKMCNE